MSEDGPDGPGRMRVHQRRRSFSDLSSTCTNRRFRMRSDHWVQTKEQALRLLLSEMWSMMWSMSSCGNSGMVVVIVVGPSPSRVHNIGVLIDLQRDPDRVIVIPKSSPDSGIRPAPDQSKCASNIRDIPGLGGWMRGWPVALSNASFIRITYSQEMYESTLPLYAHRIH